MNKYIKSVLFCLIAVFLIGGVLYFARLYLSAQKDIPNSNSYDGFDLTTGKAFPKNLIGGNPPATTTTEQEVKKKKTYTDTEMGLSVDCFDPFCPLNKKMADRDYLRQQAEENLPGQEFIKSGQSMSYDFGNASVSVYSADYLTGTADMGEFGHLSDIPENILRDKAHLLKIVCSGNDVFLGGCDIVKCEFYNHNPEIVVKYSVCRSVQVHGGFLQEEAYILTKSKEYPLVSVIGQGTYLQSKVESRWGQYQSDKEFDAAIDKEWSAMKDDMVQMINENSGQARQDMEEFSSLISSIRFTHK